jgi:polyisoprenoid-binding protein YceI
VSQEIAAMLPKFIALSVAAAVTLLPGTGSAAPTRYKLESEHTFPSLEFPHMGLSIWRGKFNRTNGTATLDRAAKTGSVTVNVDTASIDFGLDSINEYALRPEWLNTAKFPTMTYSGTLVFAGDQPVAVDGQLTLRGVTRPLRLRLNTFKCIDHPFYKKEACGADAEGELDRADFGMNQYTEDGAGRIRLRIQVEAVKED